MCIDTLYYSYCLYLLFLLLFLLSFLIEKISRRDKGVIVTVARGGAKKT